MWVGTDGSLSWFTLLKKSDETKDGKKRRRIVKEMRQIERKQRNLIGDEMLREIKEERDSARLYSLLHSFYYIKRGTTRAFGETGVYNREKKVVVGQEVGETTARFFEALGKNTTADDDRFDKGAKAERERMYLQIKEGKCGDKVQGLDDPISLSEVEAVLKRQPKNKACGPDGLVFELFQGSEKASKALHVLLSECWDRAQVPGQWLLGLVTLLHKGGDVRDLDNYRGITLLSVLHKLYTSIIRDRLARWCEDNNKLADEQNGFRENRGCRDNTFLLQEMLAIRKKRGKKTFSCFVDLRKAFDRVDRMELLVQLHAVGVKGHMFNVIEQMNEQVVSKALVNGSTTRSFKYDMGIRQGDPLSPLLFAIYINSLVQHLRSSCPTEGIFRHGDHRIQVLLYADDLVLLADSAAGLQLLMDALGVHAKLKRYEVSAKKTKVLVFLGADGARAHGLLWHVGDVHIDEAVEYLYLGVWLDVKLNGEKEKQAKRGKLSGALAMIRDVAQRSRNRVGIEHAEYIYRSRFLSLFEGGSCLHWGASDCKEFDTEVHTAWRYIVGAHSKVATGAIQGDLGYWSLKGRIDFARLKWWKHMDELGGGRLLHSVYRMGCNISSDWWATTEKLRKALGLRRAPAGILEEELKGAIQKREEEAWLIEIGKKSTLEVYRILKVKLVRENYIDVEIGQSMRIVILEMRADSHLRLRVAMGRQERIPREKRLCPHCDAEEVESARHCLFYCEAWKAKRLQLFGLFCGNNIGLPVIDPESVGWLFVDSILGYEVLPWVKEDRNLWDRQSRFFLADIMRKKDSWGLKKLRREKKIERKRVAEEKKLKELAELRERKRLAKELRGREKIEKERKSKEAKLLAKEMKAKEKTEKNRGGEEADEGREG